MSKPIPEQFTVLREHSFWIPGEPAPGGSKKVIPNRKKFRGPNDPPYFLVDDAKNNRKWKAIVNAYAKAFWDGKPIEGPCELHCMFFLARPTGHFGTGANAGTIKGSAPRFHTIRPDASKFRRSTEDAMKGVVYNDDGQIVDGSQGKRYCGIGQTPGCLVTVKILQ